MDPKDTLPSPNSPSPSPRRASLCRLAVKALATLALVALVTYQATGYPGRPEKISFDHVRWRPCEGHAGYLCGRLNVPTDYFNASAGTTTLALSKLPSSSPPSERLGTLFINPGGPGGSGYEFTFRLSMAPLLRGRYDIVGFDPRGIGRTSPRVECFPSAAAFTDFKRNTVLERGVNVPPFASLDDEYGSILREMQETLALAQVKGEVCASRYKGGELQHMGTSTVVRDIEKMSMVLDGPDARINFYGGSYGTILGAYLVNMLPSKVGRVAIDGVASSPQWANVRSDLLLYDWLNSTEVTYEWFLRDCLAAGPEGCPLVLPSDTKTHEIEKRLETYLEELYWKPRAISDGPRPAVLTSGAARRVLYASTNAPHSWPATAHVFARAIHHSDPLPLFLRAFPSLSSSVPTKDGYTPSGQTDLSRLAVGCADGPDFEEGENPTAEGMANETLRVIKGPSRHFGGSVSVIEPDGGCEFWPKRGNHPKGFRFSGPWNATLETPMLIISNTADPITPLSSGREINALMGPSSRLLIQDSPGHCSSGSASICTSRHIQRYFLDGTLPEDETLCPIDDSFFPEPETEVASLLESTPEDRELLKMARTRAREWTAWLEEHDILESL